MQSIVIGCTFEVFFTDFRVKFNKIIISKHHLIAIREKFIYGNC
jgi:hypothetical protein